MTTQNNYSTEVDEVLAELEGCTLEEFKGRVGGYNYSENPYILKAKSRIDILIYKAKLDEIKHLCDFYETNPEYPSNYITERVKTLQAALTKAEEGL